MSSLEHRIPSPLVMIIIAAAMWLIAQGATAIAIPDALRYATAFGFFLFAGIFAFPAFRAFTRAGTTINPVQIEDASKLVTSGIYRWTRNPMYVGLTFILLAWATWLAVPWLFFGPVLFAAFITRFQIVPEERMLLKKFGGSYEEYRRNVRRWL
jgi:protein-S-isoprenylcysteine O-methyltransferase Ste14